MECFVHFLFKRLILEQQFAEEPGAVEQTTPSLWLIFKLTDEYCYIEVNPTYY